MTSEKKKRLVPMTTKEFKDEYDKLVKNFPTQFENPSKEVAVAKAVRGLDKEWWEKTVLSVIAASTPYFNFHEVGSAERRARQSDWKTKALIAQEDREKSAITGSGYQSMKEKFGVKSLSEIFNKKGEK